MVTSYFFKIHFNIILPSMPNRCFHSHFPIKICYAFLISPKHTTCPAHVILLKFISLIIYRKCYKLWNSLCNFLQPPVLPLGWETKFHTHKKHQIKKYLWFWVNGRATGITVPENLPSLWTYRVPRYRI
jgi:hypothetical protein